MISYERALEIIAGLKPKQISVSSQVHSAVRMPLSESLGRVLAKPLFAMIPSPPFTNSAMDGFAVHVNSIQVGKPIRISGKVFARASGGVETPNPGLNACVRIMTGAPLPTWADAVIPVEKATQKDNHLVQFTSHPSSGDHVRSVGEDIPEGNVILESGSRLTPEALMIAASFGHTHAEVATQPRIVIVSTGDELVEPGTRLKAGEIYNSSKYFLHAAATSAGLTAIHTLSVADNIADAGHSIAAELRDESPLLIITTGAVSAGEKDFIPELAAKLGFETLFHKVAIRPGKPVFCAKRGTQHAQLWLGLPGNPISTAATWHYFGRPLLAAWAGLPDQQKISAVLSEDFKKPEALRCFFRATYKNGKVTLHKNQGSSHFLASTVCNAYVELPENCSAVKAGTELAVVLA